MVTQFGLNIFAVSLAVTLCQGGLYRVFDVLIMCPGAVGQTHCAWWQSGRRINLACPAPLFRKATDECNSSVWCSEYSAFTWTYPVPWLRVLAVDTLYVHGNQSWTQAKRCTSKPDCVVIWDPRHRNLLAWGVRNVRNWSFQNVTLSLVLWVWNLVCNADKERRLRLFRNKVPRRTFGPKRGPVGGEWRKQRDKGDC